MVASLTLSLPVHTSLAQDVATPAWQSLARTAIERVLSLEVPEELPPWIEGYERVGHRSSFIWRWVLRGLEITALTSVPEELQPKTTMIKVLGVMLDCLLDDIADVRQDDAMLAIAAQIPFSKEDEIPGEKQLDFGARQYLAFTRKVWREIQRRSEELPRYKELEAIFRYDYDQLLNTMRYAVLVNRHPFLLNMVENELYQPHNMHMMISSTIDLMASPSFDVAEIGLLREVIWRAQRMGRIGNQVSTWEREIKDADYTSEVFAYALSRGIIRLDQIHRRATAEMHAAMKREDVEGYFLEQWQKLHGEIAGLAPLIRSTAVLRLLAGLEELIKLHMGSKGLK